MSPIAFESLLLLKKNVKFWDIGAVARAMKQSDANNADEDELSERDGDELCQCVGCVGHHPEIHASALQSRH